MGWGLFLLCMIVCVLCLVTLSGYFAFVDKKDFENAPEPINEPINESFKFNVSDEIVFTENQFFIFRSWKGKHGIIRAKEENHCGIPFFQPLVKRNPDDFTLRPFCYDAYYVEIIGDRTEWFRRDSVERCAKKCS
jgi:hypothetical protein